MRQDSFMHLLRIHHRLFVICLIEEGPFNPSVRYEATSSNLERDTATCVPGPRGRETKP